MYNHNGSHQSNANVLEPVGRQLSVRWVLCGGLLVHAAPPVPSDHFLAPAYCC